MKEQNILHWILPAIVVSLLGLGALQIILLRDTYDQMDQAFGKNVLNAMQQVTRALETREAQIKVSSLIAQAKSGTRMVVVTNAESHRSEKSPDSVSFNFNFVTADPATDSVYFKDGMVFIARCLPIDASDTTIIRKGKNGLFVKQIMVDHGAGTHRSDSGSVLMGNLDHKIERMFTDSLQTVHREELLASVFDVLDAPGSGTVAHGVKPASIDSLLKKSFNECGISIPYVFGIKSSRNSALGYLSDSSRNKDLLASEFNASLFPGQLLASNSKLAVFFPGRQVFLLRKIAPSVIATIIFMVVILGSFVYTIRTIYRQKQFAGRLTDFINNITHEFKTPLSTISIVTDTLANPDVIRRVEKVQQYNAIIRDETTRLKTHVDKILQLAVLEEGDYEFKMSQVDAHDIIRDAAEHFSVQVEKREGTLTSHLKAERWVITADPYHLLNIIMNLLDNAEKYSREKPDITITTGNSGNRFWVRVEDKGIGIPEGDQAHIFEKYYRVTQGNRHDAKGFGLGLSYVKLTVGAHHGTIALTSKQWEGTAVTIDFPLAEA
jgi:two-component system phosphate regulon sensor histidine kinase PhoR